MTTTSVRRPGAVSPPGAPRPSWGVDAVAVALLLGQCWALRRFVTDDSWITVRYAENLAAGDGPVWNPGGPVVEGASNPLLVLVEAAVAWLGGSALGTARVVGVVCAVGCVLVLHRLGRHVVGGPAAATGALVTAATAPFALWAVGGLETTAVALVLTTAVLLLARPDGGPAVATGTLLAVLPWLRPEGLAPALALVAASEVPRWLTDLRARRRPHPGRLLVLAGLPLASQAVLEAGRLAVYGHLLPNSVVYKSGTGPPFDVLGGFVLQGLPVVLLALVGAALVRGRARLVAVPGLVYAAGSVGTLDSANAWSRFFVPVWPQLALLAGVALVAATAAVLRRSEREGAVGAPAGQTASYRERARSRRRTAVTVAAVAGLAATLLVLPGSLVAVDRWQERYGDCKVAPREAAARWLRTSTPAGTTFSVSDAGYVPARAGGRTAVDAFLLNDPLIQQTGPLPVRVRADLVHDRRPDVLLLASRTPDEVDGVYPTDAAVAADPRAQAYEVAATFPGARDGCGYSLVALRRG